MVAWGLAGAQQAEFRLQLSRSLSPLRVWDAGRFERSPADLFTARQAEHRGYAVFSKPRLPLRPVLEDGFCREKSAKICGSAMLCPNEGLSIPLMSLSFWRVCSFEQIGR